MDAEWINLMESRHPVLYRVLLAAMTDSDKSYLAYMAVRLLEMRRILKDTGSLYLHCDPTMSHYLKLLLDAVFGRRRFLNEIIWCYRGGGVPRTAFARKHDIILFYTKGKQSTFHRQHVPYSEATKALISKRGGTSIDGKARDLERGATMPDWWTDINSLQTWSPQRTGYPTQKPLSLLQRIVTASSNPGDIVFDPFCGCATTLVAADDFAALMGRYRHLRESRRSNRGTYPRPSRTVPRHRSPHRHPKPYRPRPDTRLQQHREPQAPLRRTGRRLRSM